MKRRTTILSISMLVVAIALTFAIVPSMAQTPPPPIAVEELTSSNGTPVRGAFTDDVAAQLRTKLDGRATGVINMNEGSVPDRRRADHGPTRRPVPVARH
jgi:hypothetical protein